MYRLFLLYFLLVSFSLFAETSTSLITGMARDAIVESLTGQTLIDRSSLITSHPFLKKDAAVFVTLNKREQLRGCIGSLQAHRTLIDDLVSNSRSAAFKDLRFLPLKKDELGKLEVEVSILTAPEAIKYDSVDSLRRQVRTGQDGIVLESGKHRATYLPQVWKQFNGFDEYFTSLCQKAGLGQGCLSMRPKIFRYHAKKYSEKSLSRRPTPNAGLFYPGSCAETEQWFTTFNQKAKQRDRTVSNGTPRALIVPHAGYVYSGYTANLAYAMAQKSSAKRIIVIGPSHRVYFEGLSAAKYEALKTPCGLLRSDEQYLQKLDKRFSFGFVKEAHAKEHSTEVQFPFINHYMPEKKVIEIIYGKSTKRELTELMVHLLNDPDNLLIISSDLSHYYAKKEAHNKDFICLDAVEQIDSKLLKSGCEACGYDGIKALLEAVKTVGLKSQLLDYRTSADASGDDKRVVGYMSAFFWR
ncbi:MAG: AmmeMemoRadiSam system protein B [Sulfurimonadaceae bacterium]